MAADTDKGHCIVCKMTLDKRQLTYVNDVGYCPWCSRQMLYYCVHCSAMHERATICKTNEKTRLKKFGFRPPLAFFDGAEGTDVYLGTEIEFEMPKKLTEAKVLEAVNRPWNYIVPDGSLSHGGELVTMPMTLGFAMEARDDIQRVLDTLRKLKCTSYQTHTCGMHVHLSRSWFSALHLHRFMTLVYSNADRFKALSRRRTRSYRTWCSAHEPPGNISDLIEKKFMPHRYTAVNLSNTNTVEVRLFRGTLDTAAVFGNLQLCHAMTHYTQQVKDVTFDALREYIGDNRTKYSDLISVWNRVFKAEEALTL